MKLTPKEINHLKDAIQIAEKSIHDIKEVIKLANEGVDINKSLLWDMKNHSSQIEAVLFNVHEDVYEPSRGVQQ